MLLVHAALLLGLHSGCLDDPRIRSRYGTAPSETVPAVMVDASADTPGLSAGIPAAGVMPAATSTVPAARIALLT
jgi:hypothetical protein